MLRPPATSHGPAPRGVKEDSLRVRPGLQVLPLDDPRIERALLAVVHRHAAHEAHEGAHAAGLLVGGGGLARAAALDERRELLVRAVVVSRARFSDLLLRVPIADVLH